MTGDEVLVALDDAAGRFGIPLAAFGELIDGCAADVRGVTYPTFDDLLHYCRCVAGSIGRLSLGVFGTTDPEQAVPLADSLGRGASAHQHPARHPRGLRRAAGSTCPPRTSTGSAVPWSGDPATGPARDKLTALVEFEADRARTWYAKGLTLMPLLDRRSAASAGAMAGIYFRLLQHIAASPAAVLTRRVSLPAREKALVAARSLARDGAAAAAPARLGHGAARRPAARRPTREAGQMSGTARAHVVVLGGGLAGITAAIALAEQGNRVTLAEARPRLGGATTLVHPRRPGRSTTASTCSCAAAPPTVGCWPGSA